MLTTDGAYTPGVKQQRVIANFMCSQHVKLSVYLAVEHTRETLDLGSNIGQCAFLKCAYGATKAKILRETGTLENNI